MQGDYVRDRMCFFFFAFSGITLVYDGIKQPYVQQSSSKASQVQEFV